MRKLSLLSLAILLAACTFTVTPDLQQRGVFISWPRAVPSVTPAPTLTATGTPDENATPTIEATVTVVPSTPAPPLPTARPLIAARVVPGGASRNLRPCPSTNSAECPAYETPLRNDMCIAVDAIAIAVVDGWSWVQYFDDRLPGGTGWVSVKRVNGTQYIDFFAVHGCVSPTNINLP